MNRLLACLCFGAVVWGAPARPLEIIRPAVQQTEDGAPAPGDIRFVPGETVFFSCQVDAYQVSPQKRVSLTYRVEAYDFRSVPLAAPVTGKVDVELSPEDKEWRPKIRHQVVIPPLADSGTFRIRVEVTDTLAGASATREVPFTVRGRTVELSDTLTVRNFRFYRGEDDPQALDLPAYRPGDTVWARFDITGYKLGPENLVHVHYAVKVTSPSGKLLFTQAEPTVEKETSFYPKRYAPCVINLTLTPNLTPGVYSIGLTVRDQVGAQTYETSGTFTVEK